MKKTLLAILLLIVILIAGLFIWRYVNYSRDPDPDKTFFLPRLGISVVEVYSLTPEKTEMNVRMLIKNILPFNFTADSFHYQLYINDAEVVKSTYAKKIFLDANDSSWIMLPITVFNAEADSVIEANEKRRIDSAEYRMHMSFNTDIIFHKSFNVTIRRYLPLVRIPELDLEKIEVDSLNTHRAAITVHAAIKNDNVFDIKFKDCTYEFQIEDNDWVKGTIPGHTNIQAKSTTNLSIPVSISLKETGKTLFKLLKKGGNLRYHLVMNLIIESENDMIKNSKAIVKSKGTVKSIVKIAKGNKHNDADDEEEERRGDKK